MHAMFIEASEKLGVDPETLAMMAISGFLNSPLVSGGTETQTVQTMQRSQASDSDDGNEHLHTSSMSNGKDYFVNVSSLRQDESVFDGMRNSEINYSGVCRNSYDDFYDAENILWGQFSRFLPIKVSLRGLAIMTEGGSPVTIDDWFTWVFESAPYIRTYLRQVDKENRIPRGEQFASGFPKDLDKSLSRYVNHSCACEYKDGTVVGLPAHLGLIHIEGEGDFSNKLVSLTQAGLEYVSISNSVIDEGSTSMAMSPEEATFMMSRIEDILPKAWGFLRFVLSSVGDGDNTPVELSAAITIVYGKGTTQNWNDKQVPTYRTGAIGLLGDMGLISRTWKFRSVTYSVTDKGKEVLSQ